MIFNFRNCDCSPLVIDEEFEIVDEDLLAQHVAKIILGHFAHVKKIIMSLSTTFPARDNSDIEAAIFQMCRTGKWKDDIEKRDGWIFQILSWLVLVSKNIGKDFYCQQPHDAAAQHGLDGIAIILDNNLIIESIIITEDKCTVKHRSLIPRVWEEFKQFERGDHNNKLVSRISAMLEFKDQGNVLEANQNNIYDANLRRYRVGINRNDTYETGKNRKKLFKGYDDCVPGINPHRRYASTMHKEDIRVWMEQFSLKIIGYLETLKTTNV